MMEKNWRSKNNGYIVEDGSVFCHAGIFFALLGIGGLLMRGLPTRNIPMLAFSIFVGILFTLLGSSYRMHAKRQHLIMDVVFERGITDLKRISEATGIRYEHCCAELNALIRMELISGAVDAKQGRLLMETMHDPRVAAHSLQQPPIRSPEAPTEASPPEPSAAVPARPAAPQPHQPHPPRVVVLENKRPPASFRPAAPSQPSQPPWQQQPAKKTQPARNLKTVRCQNCGANNTSAGDHVICEYCGTAIK